MATPTPAAVAAAAAMANLDVIEREGLVSQVRHLEPVLTETLAGLADQAAGRWFAAGVPAVVVTGEELKGCASACWEALEEVLTAR